MNDQGVFELSVAGRKIGAEEFEISSAAGKVEARAEIHLRVEKEGKAVDLKTFPVLALNPQLQLLTYAWDQKGSQVSSLEVDFRSPPAKVRYRTVTGEEDNREFNLPKDVLVLDDNVIHHYQLAVHRYRLTPGGKQTFQAFIPQEALPGLVTVEEIGVESVQIRGRTENLHHLVLTTELAQIDLWTDDENHLQLVSIPATQLEGVRKKQ